LTGIGMIGGATFKTAVRLEVGPRVGSCLEVSMISGGDSSVIGATLTSDQTVSSNSKYQGSGGATINANVETVQGANGNTYTKSITTRTTDRSMPDPSTALSYYTTNGTTIQYSDLPLWSPTEMLTNTTFETNVTGWSQ